MVDGLQPSLLANKINVTQKTLKLFLQKIHLADSGCWLWTGATSAGYGVVKVRAIAQHFLPAHRFAYELAYGPVDKSLDVHHKVEDGCTGKLCVNPAHLEPVARRKHLTELTPGCASYVASHRDCCARGHKYTFESTRMTKRGRECRICDKDDHQVARDVDRGDRPKHKKKHLATHCKRGHALEGENLYFYDTPWGQQRRCVACQKLRHEKSKSGECSS